MVSSRSEDAEGMQAAYDQAVTRAVIADLDQHADIVRERARLGIDRWDELWEGVLHLVPPPAGRHQRLGGDLYLALRPRAEAAGLLISYETGVWRVGDDYRIPDLAVYPADRASDRGVDGPPLLVVEIRSPGDETDAKIGWYLDLGVEEVVVTDRDTRECELHTLAGTAGSPVRSRVLEVTIRLPTATI
jgi:Uma2 family endonuclease